jgi:hypothetical protein
VQNAETTLNEPLAKIIAAFCTAFCTVDVENIPRLASHRRKTQTPPALGRRFPVSETP